MKASELQLGDIVSLGFDGYSTATVNQIDDKQAHLIRPYIHSGDCVYSGNQVATYIGQETVRIPLRDSRDTMKLIERRDPEQTHKAIKAIKEQIEQALGTRNIGEAVRLLRQL